MPIIEKHKKFLDALTDDAGVAPDLADGYADACVMLVAHASVKSHVFDDSDVAKDFDRSPDGMFFVISSGLALPLGRSIDDLPDETTISVPLEDSQVAVDDTYAIAVFGDFLPGARSIRAASIFQARAVAEMIAGESARTVSLARAVGTLKDGTILFQGMEFIEFRSESDDTIKASTTTVQTLIFDKEFFDASSAKAWAKEHGFKATKVDTTENSIRLRQRTPGAFKQGSFRTIKIARGIQAVIGKPKATKESAATEKEVELLLDKAIHRRKPKEKTEKSGYRVEKEAVFVHKEEMKQIVFGIVYSPNQIDAHEDFMTSDEVEEMAHKFLINYRHDITVGMDKQHDEVIRDADIVQSFIADPSDVRFKDNPGAWVIAVKVHDNSLWQEIMSGEISGFSLMGVARHVETGQKPAAAPAA